MTGSSRRSRAQPPSAVAEAYRILRSSVKFAEGERPIRSVLIVDVDREQPSGVAEQLARSFASAGDRALLVETDVRRRTEREPGFVDLVYGNVALDAVVRPGSVGEPATILPGSQADVDVLASAGFGNALDLLTSSYDIVVLSAATMPTYGDAIAIAPRVDATILVVTSGRTRRPRAIEARDALDRVGARVLGIVMVESERRLFW